MENELNVTYITLGGFAGIMKCRYPLFLFLLLVYFLIILCNSLLVYVVWVHSKLHEPMYVFIAALSVNSILWSLVMYPKLLIDLMSEKQIISWSACLVQCNMFYSVGGTDFLLLAAMAYDRYVSICKPLKYATVMKKSVVCALLAVAWLFPASNILLTALNNASTKLCRFTIRSVFCNNTTVKLYCAIPLIQTALALLVLLNVAFFPFVFILFTYARILVVAYRSSGEVKRKAAQTCLPHILVLINFSCLCGFDVITVNFDSELSDTFQLVMALQLITLQPLLNPVIYGLKMKHISKHLRILLSCRNHHRRLELR